MSVFRASNWPVEWPLFALAASAVLYLLGGRMSAAATDASKRWRGFAFYAGLVAVAVAVDSPVDAYADRLFWVHMIQHVLLMMVAPPLLLLGRPWPRLIRPLPLPVRRPVAPTVLAGQTLRPVRRLGRWIAGPLPSFALFNATLLLLHLPGLYDPTLPARRGLRAGRPAAGCRDHVGARLRAVLRRHLRGGVSLARPGGRFAPPPVFPR